MCCGVWLGGCGIGDGFHLEYQQVASDDDVVKVVKNEFEVQGNDN